MAKATQIMIDGELKNLTTERIISGVEANGKFKTSPLRNRWQYPTTFSKIVDLTIVFGLTAIILGGIYLTSI